MNDNLYYVYQHKKKDSQQIFYVGKGKNNRLLESSNRNRYWHNIVNKHGFFSEIVIDNLNEELSLLVEKELIDKYKKIGILLTNLTDGGEGVSGLKHSVESKNKMAKKALGRKLSLESKQKISKYWKGKKRKPFTEEHKLKISEKRQNQIMKPIEESTKNKISLANTGKKRTPEQRKKISEATKLALLKKRS